MLKLSSKSDGVMKGVCFSEQSAIDSDQHNLVEFQARRLKDGKVELWISDTRLGGFGKKKSHTKQLYFSYSQEAYQELLNLLNEMSTVPSQS